MTEKRINKIEGGTWEQAEAAQGTSGVEALAQVMREYDKVGEFWDAYYRDAAERILADPGPLLEALAEAGVLEVEGSVRRGCGCRVREGNIAASCCYLVGDGGPDVPERRYVTEWMPAADRTPSVEWSAADLAREIAELVEPYIQQAYSAGCANSLRQAAEVFQAEAFTGSPLTPGNIAMRLNRMAGQYDAG